MAGEAVTRSGQPVGGDSNGCCVAGPDSDSDDYRYGPPDRDSPGSSVRPAMLGRGWTADKHRPAKPLAVGEEGTDPD